jgi:ubiquinone/menaquinone biosynthesis C-methylase UbiE
MNSSIDIHTYYNNLASTYDENRFGNTYGQYLHQQESKFLKKVIRNKGNILDLGCGTGRHLEFATHGLDLSENMIEEASNKFPEKILTVGSAFETGFEKETFDQAYTFHVLMHLSKEQIIRTLEEVFRILKPGGQFIFDIPSKKRRKLIRYKTDGWHGAASLSIAEIKEMIGDQWIIQRKKGVLFMPIQRFPKGIRKMMLPFDNALCSSPFKEYSSYLMVVLEKK